MALYYSKTKVVLNAMLELLASIFLLPLTLRLKLRTRNDAGAILLVEPFGMGDILSLSVMLDPLKGAYPDAELIILTKTGNEEIYAGDSRITRTYTVPVPWSRLSGQKRGSLREWVGLLKVCRRIAALKPELGLDTRGEIRDQILMVLCGCRRRVGFLNYLNTNINLRGWLLTEAVEKPGILHRYDMNRLLLSSGLGIELSPLMFPSFKPQFSPEMAGDAGLNILFHIGARWRYRQWPAEHWIELARDLAKAGIVARIVGATTEKKVLDQISIATESPALVANMEELICLIMGADLLVCLDSGPMHLAQTLGVPVVALFGPGDFELWCPRGERDEVIFHRLPCNPCLQERCVRSGDSCMTMITVEEVFTAVKKVLDLKTDLCEK